MRRKRRDYEILTLCFSSAKLDAYFYCAHIPHDIFYSLNFAFKRIYSPHKVIWPIEYSTYHISSCFDIREVSSNHLITSQHFFHRVLCPCLSISISRFFPIYVMTALWLSSLRKYSNILFVQLLIVRLNEYKQSIYHKPQYNAIHRWHKVKWHSLSMYISWFSYCQLQNPRLQFNIFNLYSISRFAHPVISSSVSVSTKIFRYLNFSPSRVL